MRKLSPFVLLLGLIIPSFTAHGMLRSLFTHAHRPSSIRVQQVVPRGYCNISHENLRKIIDRNAHYNNSDGSIIDPAIKILEKIPQGKRYGVCHTYAISEKLGLKGTIPQSLPVAYENDWYTEFNFLTDYCQEVSVPMVNDFVIYKHKNDQSHEILHTGLVHDNGIVQSKWGTLPAVLTHPTFAVPSRYGNYVKYYRLVQPIDEIKGDMKLKIARSQSTNIKYFSLNTKLINATDGSDIESVEYFLERHMCTDVNTINFEHQSLLIIAAKNNNLPLVNMLLNYNVDVNKQDMYGNTALHFAAKNGSAAMMKTLYEKNCNTELKDNEGKNASHYYCDYKNLPLMTYISRSLNNPID